MQQGVSCDVVVVGGGFAGLLSADRLSRLGYDVVLIEQAVATLAGPSGRNEGWLHAGTYHALSIEDRAQAVEVARRCLIGWEEVQRRFPEAIERESAKSIAVVPGALADEATSRWQEAGVAYAALSRTEMRRYADSIRVDRDERCFAVEDLAVNTRMFAAGVIGENHRRGVTTLLGTSVVRRSGDVLHVETPNGPLAILHRFIVCAAGYAMGRLCELLDLPEVRLRLWRSHLVTLPRLAPTSVFGVAPGQAAMINHGVWSVVGLNEDATVVAHPTFEADPTVAQRLLDAVRQRFPAVDVGDAEVTACVKVDYTKSAGVARSLNVRLLPLLDNAAAVLPGKMTEAPYVANLVATHVFEALGHSGVSMRPLDLRRTAPGWTARYA